MRPNTIVIFSSDMRVAKMGCKKVSSTNYITYIGLRK